MRVILTGGTGFVGQHLTHRLLSDNHQIICLLRPNSPREQSLAQKNIEIKKIDLSDLEGLKTVVQNANADIVYHLAGSVFSKDKRELFEVNCDGALNLYAAIKQSNVKCFVHLSSIAAVGPSNLERLSEKTIPKPISDYGKSKRKAERILIDSFMEIKKPIVIVRCPLIYGDGMSCESRLKQLGKKIYNGSFFFLGSGENKISLCSVRSLVDFLISIPNLKIQKHEIYHIADAKVFTLRELVTIIAEAQNVAVPHKVLSGSIALVLSSFLENLSRIISVNNPWTAERVKEIMGNWDVDITKAENAGFIAKQSLSELTRQITCL